MKERKIKNPLLSNPRFSGPGWYKQEGTILLLKAANCMDTIGKSHIKLHVLNTEARQLLYILYVAQHTGKIRQSPKRNFLQMQLLVTKLLYTKLKSYCRV